MSERCAECGALLDAGSTCQATFEEFLALEYTNPAYGRVHFLTVACFMIQHRRYSDQALGGIYELLRAYFEEQLTDQQLRQRTASSIGHSSRTWKITRQAGDPPLPFVAWSMTISDVARHMQHPDEYCERITAWARVTLQEMSALMH